MGHAAGPRARTPRLAKSELVKQPRSVAFTATEAVRIKRQARREGRSFSAWVRLAALDKLGQRGKTAETP